MSVPWEIYLPAQIRNPKLRLLHSFRLWKFEFRAFLLVFLPTTRQLSTIPTGAGMVECERFLIIKRSPLAPFASHYDILDAATQKQLGIARARPDKLAPLLGRLGESRFLPMTVEAHETEDDPAVLLLRLHAGFLRAH